MVYARRFLAVVAVALVFWVDLIAIPVYFVMTGRSYIEDYNPIVEAVFEFIMTGHWNWKDDEDEEKEP